MKPLFRYSFQDNLGDYYYIDTAGDVQLSPSAKYLTDDPDDWADTQVSFDRNEDASGIFRKSTIPLSFHSDAALILRHIYYTDYFNGYCKFTVEKQNRSFAAGNLNYATWFVSEVDFGQSQDGDMELPPGDVFFTVRLMELGLQAVLDNHKDDTFEIPIFTTWDDNPANRILDGDAKEIEVGGVTLNGSYEWVIPETKDASGNPTTFVIPSPSDLEYLDAAFFAENTVFTIGRPGTQLHGVGGAQNVWRFDAPCTTDFHIKFDFEYFNNLTLGTVHVRFIRTMFDKDGTSLGTTQIYLDPVGAPAGGSSSFSIDYIDSPPYVLGATVAYYFEKGGGSNPIDARISSDGFIKMASTFSMPPSRMHGFTYKALMQKLLDKMAGNTNYTVVSDLLDDGFLDYFTRPSHNLVVPAASIRQLDDPKIKTSFMELITDLRTMFGVGWGVEGDDLRVERQAYFYNPAISLLSVASNSTVQKSTANDFIYNRIKIGFKDTSVDEINGLQEFCCEHEYNCGLTAPTIGSKELNLVSAYIHGLYSIENIRSYLFRSDTTSTPTDNETCVIEYNVVGGGIHYPAKTGFNGTTFNNGVKYPADIYNTGHSPKACLIRNLNYIKSYLQDGQIISFNTATKNANLEYGNASITIKENSNIEITTDGAKIPATSDLYPGIGRMFLPFIFEFVGEVPEHLLALMETPDSGSFKKYGILEIDDKGVPVEMFILDIGVTPASDDVYQIRGLCSPSMNLTNLIR